MRILNTEKCSPQLWLVTKARDELEEAKEDFYVAIETYKEFIKKCPKEEYNTRYFQDHEYAYRKEIDRQALRVHDLEKLISEHDTLRFRHRWVNLDDASNDADT